jgi:cytochrome oxidase Cu insertion factor (SCO1/SenC/PrrC family)
MNTRRILAGALVAIVAAGGGVLASHWLNGGKTEVAANAQPVSGESAVAQLWSAPVTTVDGKPQTLSSLKGHPIVVNF